MKQIKLILASVRDKRAGDKVAAWVLDEAEEYKANLEFSLIDLKELALPSMNEPVPPKAGNVYKYEHTRRWSKIANSADGFIIITPEYNHGYPGSLKNALDYLYREWVGKPVGIVGYGGNGAGYARKHLKDVFSVIGLVPMEEEIAISRIWEAFDESGKPIPELMDGSISKLLGQIDSFVKKN